MNEFVKTAFSHENKIYGVTSSGHLAEWSTKELKWVVRGQSEVVDHATAKVMKTKEPSSMPGLIGVESFPENQWKELILTAVVMVGIFACVGAWLL